MFYLKGLIIGFFLISCSGDQNEDSEGGFGEFPRERTESEETEGTEGTAGSGVGGVGGADNMENRGSDPNHWIFSVPFQRIEAGSFMMGSPADESGRDSDETQVQVTISKPFEIMKHEVTQSQWVKMMGENSARFKSQKHCDNHEQDMCPNHPVDQVSWNDVQAFIWDLNEALDLSGCDGTPGSSSGCYRLPTEAEWEYATRAGTTTAYFYSADPAHLRDYAWFKGNAGGQTQEVCQKQPNPHGLCDVYGNVWEWVQDSYAKTLPGGNDPLNISGSYRIIRGGGWYHGARYLRSANRYEIRSAFRSYGGIGFRLVRTL